MRHRKSGRHLGRTSSHRRALRRNMACSLFLHGRIKTTPEKAKELRQFAEKLITLGKKGGLNAFRRALQLLDNKPVVRRLFREIAPRFSARPGGYTRILRLGAEATRLGDKAQQVFLELVEPMPEAAEGAAPPESKPAPTPEEKRPEEAGDDAAAQDSEKR